MEKFEWKGTQLAPLDEFEIQGWDDYDIVHNGEIIAEVKDGEDVELFYDSLIVQNEIDFPLLELRERYFKLTDIVDSLIDPFTGMVHDGMQNVISKEDCADIEEMYWKINKQIING